MVDFANKVIMQTLLLGSVSLAMNGAVSVLDLTILSVQNVQELAFIMIIPYLLATQVVQMVLMSQVQLVNHGNFSKISFNSTVCLFFFFSIKNNFIY